MKHSIERERERERELHNKNQNTTSNSLFPQEVKSQIDLFIVIV